MKVIGIRPYKDIDIPFRCHMHISRFCRLSQAYGFRYFDAMGFHPSAGNIHDVQRSVGGCLAADKHASHARYHEQIVVGLDFCRVFPYPHHIFPFFMGKGSV